MTTIALIHGAYHTSSCWALMIPELGRRGYTVRTIDLPTSDPQSGTQKYARRVIADLTDVEDDLVLVGHSMGGLTIPLVASARVVRQMVFVCGSLPVPGMSLREQFGAEPIQPPFPSGLEWIEHPDGTWIPSDATARALFYQEAADNAFSWAVRQLRRQAMTPIDEITPLERWPDVPSTYVMTRQDRMVSPEWARTGVRKRLGVDPIELPGDHSPFVSRPRALAEAIIDNLV